MNEYDKSLYMSQNECEIESLKIPIPSPSCVAVQRVDCLNVRQLERQECLLSNNRKSNRPKVVCDYYSIEKAEASQVSVYKSCMALNGWQEVWQEYEQVLPNQPHQRTP